MAIRNIANKAAARACSPTGVLLPHLSCTVLVEIGASRLFSVE
ncbi:hypothetical protein CDS [Bradyrhizobium sp.]|nr:hypothetical protein CDS [Bradyrhizobium sp.]